MRNRTTQTSTISLVLVGLFASGSTLANANGPITFGDVMATFQASPVGFVIADNNSAVAVGTRHARIFPRNISTAHCENDWLVAMSVAVLPKSLSKEQVAAILDSEILSLYLDGVEQEAMTTSIKAAQLTELFGQLVWYRNTGFFIAPGDLPVGTHAVDFVFTDTATGDILGTATHFVEIVPADSEACANGS